MEIKELKEKFESLKKRLSAVEKIVTVAETQKQSLTDRLKDEYNITPDKLPETIEKMNDDINKTKETISNTLDAFEEALKNVEKIVNV